MGNYDDASVYLQNSAVIASDWIGFLSLAATSVYLFWKLLQFRGPDKHEHYFMGYRESKMLSVFVNLFAALAYWARVCAHANGDVGPAAQVVAYKYLDYLFTCPLLTVDLMWSLNLPYKVTYGGFVFCCIICAFCCSTLDGSARYMWFGLGISLFSFTWYSIITLVKIRLDQFVDTEAKKTRQSLKIACITYFGIWCAYPTLWMLLEIGVLNEVISHVLHALFDVLAKSVYGLALLAFLLKSEKKEIIFMPLYRAGKEKRDTRSSGASSSAGDSMGSVSEEKHSRSNKHKAKKSGTVIGAPHAHHSHSHSHNRHSTSSWVSRSEDLEMGNTPGWNAFPMRQQLNGGPTMHQQLNGGSPMHQQLNGGSPMHEQLNGGWKSATMDDVNMTMHQIQAIDEKLAALSNQFAASEGREQGLGQNGVAAGDPGLPMMAGGAGSVRRLSDYGGVGGEGRMAANNGDRGGRRISAA